MKLSELVKALTYELNEHGDIDVILASDEERNSLYNVEDISTFDDDDTANAYLCLWPGGFDIVDMW